MKKTILLIITLIIFSCSNEESCEQYPSLITNEVDNISDTSANLVGEITPPTCDDTVTSQGFVFGKENLPTIENNKKIKSGSIIEITLNNLEQNTTYFVRTFFENPTGVYYGNEISFNTNVGEAIVNTKEVFNITATNASISGKIISNGGGNIKSKGFCFSNQTKPTIDNQIIEGTDGNNQFNGTLINLSPNTRYYIKAYTENESGFFYGEERVFDTKSGEIEISTIQPYDFKENSVVLGGEITDLGGTNVIEKGIVWSRTPNPNVNSYKLISTNNNSNYEIEANIGIYSNENKYFYKSYAINDFGIFYGQEIEFKIYYELTDIDGNTYDNSYMCNGKLWSKESLKVKHYINGDEIPYVSDRTEWRNADYGAWCYLDNDPEKGVLYNYYAIEDSRGLIPEGWLLPIGQQFLDIEICDNNLTNANGFNIAETPNFRTWAGGFWSHYNEDNPHPHFWLRSYSNNSYRSINYTKLNNEGLSLSNGDKNSGYSIRLIKNPNN